MHKEAIIDWAIPIVLLFILTVLFRIFPWDLQLEAIFYSSENGWFAKDLSFWIALYNYASIPAFYFIFNIHINSYRWILKFQTQEI